MKRYLKYKYCVPIILALIFLFSLYACAGKPEGGGEITVQKPEELTVPPGENKAPIAKLTASPGLNIVVGTSVVVDGKESSDPEGVTLSFKWELTPPSDSKAKLPELAPSAPSFEFTPDVVGGYTVGLTVSDGVNVSEPARIVIQTLSPNVLPPIPGPVTGGPPAGTVTPETQPKICPVYTPVWSQMDEGLDCQNQNVDRVVVVGGNLFGINGGRIFKFNNDRWVKVSYDTGSDSPIGIIVGSGPYLAFSLKNSSVFYTNIENAGPLLTNNLAVNADVQDILITSLDQVYLGTSKGVFFGYSGFPAWSKISPVEENISINTLESGGGFYYAGGTDGLYQFNVGSWSWSQIPSTLKNITDIVFIPASPPRLYVISSGRLYRFNQKIDKSWEGPIFEAGAPINLSLIKFSQGQLYAGSSSGLYYKSVISGGDSASWETTQLKDTITSFDSTSDAVYASISEIGVKKLLPKQGTVTTLANTGFPRVDISRPVITKSGVIAVNDSNGRVYKYSLNKWVTVPNLTLKNLVAIDDTIFGLNEDKLYMISNIDHPPQELDLKLPSGSNNRIAALWADTQEKVLYIGTELLSKSGSAYIYQWSTLSPTPSKLYELTLGPECYAESLIPLAKWGDMLLVGTIHNGLLGVDKKDGKLKSIFKLTTSPPPYIIGECTLIDTILGVAQTESSIYALVITNISGETSYRLYEGKSPDFAGVQGFNLAFKPEDMSLFRNEPYISAEDGLYIYRKDLGVFEHLLKDIHATGLKAFDPLTLFIATKDSGLYRYDWVCATSP